MILEYIQIFWTNISSRKNICRFFLGQTYLDIHWWKFYHAKYIQIFIRPKKDIRTTLDWSGWEGCRICLSRIDDPVHANQTIIQTTKIWEKSR